MEVEWGDLEHAAAIEVNIGSPTRITVSLPGRAVQHITWLMGLAGVVVLMTHHRARERRGTR